MKLRHMSATVDNVPTITLELETGEIVDLNNATVLTSYASRVAVFCDDTVYLLPRYDYSVTTWKHLHAFIQDYCDTVSDHSANKIREIASGKTNSNSYIFANSIGWRDRNGNLVAFDCY